MANSTKCTSKVCDFRGMPTAIRALSDATLRFDLALGVRRRHAPKVAKNRVARRRLGAVLSKRVYQVCNSYDLYIHGL